MLEKYLHELEESSIDSLILGCTHYPLFKPLIKKVLHNSEIEIVDSATAIAGTTQKKLKTNNLLNSNANPSFTCYVSDRPQRFQKLAERFLGQRINDVHIRQLG